MSNQPVTVILPLGLGAVANFDQDVFPLATHDGRNSNLGKGSLLLSATMEELIKIKEMGVDLANSGDFLYNTRIEYQALLAKKAKLQDRRKTYNPFKLFRHYRAARLFHAASLNLYYETKRTSETMQRDHILQSVPSADIHAFEGSDAPADAVITHIAISLPGALDDEARQAISDATAMIVSHASESFAEGSFLSQLEKEEEYMYRSLADTDASSLDLLNSIPDSSFNESNETPDTPTIGPSSPQSITIHVTGDYYHNSILSTNSSLIGVTINEGSGNTGASVSQ